MIRVLVADDQPLVRSGFRMILDERDDLALVGEAEHGEQAVKLADESSTRRDPDGRPHARVDGVGATRRLVTPAAGARYSSSPPSTSTNTSTRRYAPAPAASSSRTSDRLISSTRSASSPPATHSSARPPRGASSSGLNNAIRAGRRVRSTSSATANEKSCACSQTASRTPSWPQPPPQRSHDQDTRLRRSSKARRPGPRPGGNRRLRRRTRQAGPFVTRCGGWGQTRVGRSACRHSTEPSARFAPPLPSSRISTRVTRRCWAPSGGCARVAGARCRRRRAPPTTAAPPVMERGSAEVQPSSFHARS